MRIGSKVEERGIKIIGKLEGKLRIDDKEKIEEGKIENEIGLMESDVKIMEEREKRIGLMKEFWKKRGRKIGGGEKENKMMEMILSWKGII